MILETVASGGCRPYLIGCPATCAAALIDPELSQIDHYLALASRDGLRIRYLVDTHTHADHFSATQQLARHLGVPVVMHSESPAPFVDLRLRRGEMLVVGQLRLQSVHTPGHTRDSMCLCVENVVFTGDTLLIGGTGRTDLPGGNADSLYNSLFEVVMKLDPALRVFPAHEYKGRRHSTIGDELAANPRLQVRVRHLFVEMMNNLKITMPTHVTEALRTNMSGGKTVAQMLSEAAAAVPFMSLAELQAVVGPGRSDVTILDVRERDAYEEGHVPGAQLLPRGQLELRVNQELTDPTRRIIVCCEFGRVSTLATYTLRQMGFSAAVALGSHEGRQRPLSIASMRTCFMQRNTTAGWEPRGRPGRLAHSRAARRSGVGNLAGCRCGVLLEGVGNDLAGAHVRAGFSAVNDAHAVTRVMLERDPAYASLRAEMRSRMVQGWFETTIQKVVIVASL